MSVFRVMATTFSITLLVACGGGGGATNNTGNGAGGSNLQSLLSLAIENTSRARNLVGGQVAPSMTSEQIFQNIETRAEAADVLQFGDLVSHASGTTLPDQTVTCSSVSCRSSFPGDIPFEVSLNNLDVYPGLAESMLEGFNADSSVVMIDNGVTMIQGRAAGRSSDGVDLEYVSYGG